MFVARKVANQKRPHQVSLESTSGSGKIFTAIKLAFAMIAQGIGSWVLHFRIDKESAAPGVDVDCDGRRCEFESVRFGRVHQNPTGFGLVYRSAVVHRYDVVIFGSVSHAWHGSHDPVAQIAARGLLGDKLVVWSTETSQYREMIHQMIQALTDPQARVLTSLLITSNVITPMREGPHDSCFELIDIHASGKLFCQNNRRENTETQLVLVLWHRMGTDLHLMEVCGYTALFPGWGRIKPGHSSGQAIFVRWQPRASLSPPQAPAASAEEPRVALLKRLAQEAAVECVKAAGEWLLTLFI